MSGVSCFASVVEFAVVDHPLRLAGEAGVAAITVILYLEFLFTAGLYGFASGIAPIISYNYGAQKYDLMKKAIRFMTQICFAYSFIIWVLISAFPELFIRIFNQEAELITAAVPSLHIYFFGFFMMAFQFTGQCVFKALNKAPQAVFFSILRKAIIVAPLTVILPRIGGLGVAGVFMAEPISNFIGGLACYITMQCTVLRKL